MQNLLQIAYEILKQDTRLLSIDGELLKNKTQELANKLDDKLIELLLSNETIRTKFFKQIKSICIFDNTSFVKFINNKEFLPDSYTSFRNKIGLANDKEDYVTNISDVMLNRPYKDCILAGGQDTEDAKRDEVFYNEVLASDEIDRLLDPKVFNSFKKYEVDNESPVIERKKDENGIIKDNLVIKGNNLFVLHSLQSNFAGKLDLIYIDPPYNTGGNGDTFEYNNKFKHSSWLTFMKNRLDIAKKLLKKDGVIIIAIDENEQAYLGVLLNEIFPEHETHCITVIHNPRGIQGTNFSYTNEFAFFVIPRGKKSIGRRKIEEEDIDWSNLRNWGAESERKDAKNCFYPIVIDRCTNEIVEFGDVCLDDFHPKVNIFEGDFVTIYPIDKNGTERKWRYARQSVDEVKDLLKVKVVKGVYDIQIGKDFGQYRTVRVDNKYDANEYGTKLVKDLVPGCKFSFPKSLRNVYDCLYAVVANKKDAKILDFFGGSGTTAHAVLELNKEDSGSRQFILVEQMDYINTVTAPRIHQVIKNNGEGSFVYMETMKNNQNFIDQINQTDSKEALISLYQTIKDSSFINYKVDIRKIDSNISEFESLNIENMKQFLVAILDQNALYVNYSEIKDSTNNVSPEDVALNNQFYA